MVEAITTFQMSLVSHPGWLRGFEWHAHLLILECRTRRLSNQARKRHRVLGGDGNSSKP